MAKIKIANYENLVDVSQATARVIKEKWLDERVMLNTPLEVSPTLTVEKRAIKAVFLDFESNQDSQNYDLSNPEHKQIIRDFENELAGRSFNEYCLQSGFYTGEPPCEIMALSKLRDYEVAKKKFNALQSLRHLRKLAQQHEAEQNAEMLSPKIEEIDKTPSDLFSNPPEMAENKPKVEFVYPKEQDEIRIEDIPF